MDGLNITGRSVADDRKKWSHERKLMVQEKVKGVWAILGEWRDYAWPSPDDGYVNIRTIRGAIDEVKSLPVVAEVGVTPARL